MTQTTISWTPIRDGFGARVDLDLSRDLDDAVLDELAALFDKRDLLVFPHQEINLETQRKVVSTVGTPFNTEVKYVSNEHDHLGTPREVPTDPDPRTVQFHSDLIFDQRLPVHGISLYAEDVSGNTSPLFQGTRFVSVRDGYQKLTDKERADLEGRTLLSLHSVMLSTEDQNGLRKFPFKEIEDQVTWWGEHPLLFPLPRTGEPILLYVPWFAHSISGLSPEESEAWFARFDEMLYQDENGIYNHRWEQGDLVFWNNLSLQHAKEVVEVVPGPLPTRTLRRQAYGPEEPNLY